MSLRSSLVCLFATLWLSGCALSPASTTASQAPDILAANQLVLVLTSDWNSPVGRLQRFERVQGRWRAAGAPFDISVGRNGLAWGEGLHWPQAGVQKREGDGRAPAGRFAIGLAFGYASSDPTALPFQQMSASHYCMDVSDSPLYNRIVDARVVGANAVAGSTEPMRLDLQVEGDMRYQLGFVIGHNTSARPGAGSCIFAHLWKAPGTPTAGCTAMPELRMRELLDWLRPGHNPVFVQLPEAEYRRLRQPWRLPEIPP